MSKIKVVALFGKSGAGKDTIQRYLIDTYPNDTKSIVSCTTRPKRDYEQDGDSGKTSRWTVGAGAHVTTGMRTHPKSICT